MANLNTPKGRTIKVIPGDPEGLAENVTRLKNVKEKVDELETSLGHVVDGSACKSHRIDELKKKAQECKGQIVKVSKVYNGVGVALGDFQTVLSDSVSKSKQLHTDAANLLPQVQTAEDNLAQAQRNEANFSNSEPQPDADPEALKKQGADLSQATTDSQTALNNLKETLDDYKKQFDIAQDSLDDASQKAKSEIGSAIDHNDAKDSWWDNVVDWLEQFKEVLGIALMVLAVAALFIPGLNLLVLGLGVALLATDLILMLSGKATVVDILLDTVSILPFGKFIGGGIKAFRTSNKSLGLLWRARGAVDRGLDIGAKDLKKTLTVAKDKEAWKTAIQNIKGLDSEGVKDGKRVLQKASERSGSPQVKNAAKESLENANSAWKNKTALQKFNAILKSPEGTYFSAKHATTIENMKAGGVYTERLAKETEGLTTKNIYYVSNGIDYVSKANTLITNPPLIRDKTHEFFDPSMKFPEQPAPAAGGRG